jgi:hypothetical protein
MLGEGRYLYWGFDKWGFRHPTHHYVTLAKHACASRCAACSSNVASLTYTIMRVFVEEATDLATVVDLYSR